MKAFLGQTSPSQSQYGHKSFHCGIELELGSMGGTCVSFGGRVEVTSRKRKSASQLTSRFLRDLVKKKYFSDHVQVFLKKLIEGD